MVEERRSNQFPTDANARTALYEAILMFAGGKRYLMRAPIRMWWNLGWKERHPGDIVHRNSKFKKNLKKLEDMGYIRRFEGGIEIMENIHA